MTLPPLLSVDHLSVHFPGARRGETVAAVREVSFVLNRGERLGLVGESGSGKSTLGRAILGLLPPPARVSAAALRLGDLDLLGLSARGWRGVRGRRMAMVLQDPRYSLNPVMTVERQMVEAGRAGGLSRSAARVRARDLLAAVRIADPGRVMAAWPHQLSGGMGQRVMMAMMLMQDPEILIADEPTSALDATVRDEVLAILAGLARDRTMAVLLISHDLDRVARFCDRVLVLYAGRVVETCAAADLLSGTTPDGLPPARHPYTRGLLAARPRLGPGTGTPADLPVLVRDPAWAEESRGD